MRGGEGPCGGMIGGNYAPRTATPRILITVTKCLCVRPSFSTRNRPSPIRRDLASPMSSLLAPLTVFWISLEDAPGDP